MFEDSFYDLLRQYPNAVENKKQFVGLMKDFFPGQQKQVNLISITYDLGIASDIAKAPEISNPFAFKFVKQLVDEYGVSRVNADWAVSVWCVCYGQQVLGKSCEIKISKAKSGAAPAIHDEHNSSGRQYNDQFVYRAVSDGYGVSGFNGTNARTLIFPNQYHGRAVTRIIAGAFEGCDVQEVVMTDGITKIEEGAFKGCINLKQIIFPNTLREIGDAAFSGCSQLVTAALPPSIEQIGNYAFAGTGLKEVEIPRNVLWMGSGVYEGCSRLTSVKLPKQTPSIPAHFLKGCSSIRKMDIPEAVQSIGEEAFSGCTGLMDMIVPEEVSTIGEDAYAGMAPEFTIRCYMRSAAEQYARKHNVPFQIVF